MYNLNNQKYITFVYSHTIIQLYKQLKALIEQTEDSIAFDKCYRRPSSPVLHVTDSMPSVSHIPFRCARNRSRDVRRYLCMSR